MNNVSLRRTCVRRLLFAQNLASLITAGLCFPALGWAQPPNVRSNTVSYSVGGYFFDSGAPGFKNFGETDFQQSMSDPNDPLSIAEPVALAATLYDSFGSGGAISTASVSLEAHSRVGILGVDLSGYLTRLSSRNSPLGEANLNEARVQARWQDTLQLGNITDPQPGRLQHIEATLRIDGGMVIDVDGSAPFNRNRIAASAVTLRVLGNSPILQDALPRPPYRAAYFAEALDSTDPNVTSYMHAVPNSIPVNIFVAEGEWFTLDFLMELRAQGVARIDSFSSTGANDFSAEFAADYGSTLTWGGIQRVTDAHTGELINGWSISSASGLDYANPVVPEPATLILLGTGVIGALLARLRFRRNASPHFRRVGRVGIAHRRNPVR